MILHDSLQDRRCAMWALDRSRRIIGTDDAIVAVIFALNAFGCLTIAVMTALRRLAWVRLLQRRGQE